MWEHSFTDYIPAKDAKKVSLNMLKLINWDVINNRIDGKLMLISKIKVLAYNKTIQKTFQQENI